MLGTHNEEIDEEFERNKEMRRTRTKFAKILPVDDWGTKKL